MNNILQGDCLDHLRAMLPGAFQCCVTSPPYYGLRDYGNADQIGLEETPELYVAKLVEVFREVRRVMREDGTLWLNLGDSYAGSGKGAWDRTDVQKEVYVPKPNGREASMNKVPNGCKPKDLIGIPWMVAFALRADGWWLRQDIIWHKPNPMPESVTDRCTKAHEYIFLLSKSARYYYDAEAVKEIAVTAMKPNSPSIKVHNEQSQGRHGKTSMLYAGNDVLRPEYSNKRSVWTVTTKPFSEAHFATFPEDLIKPCILAGCPEDGIVYDPFMGAGTTALVAHKLHRNFIGSELNPEYIKIADKRLKPYLTQMKLL